MKTQEFLLSFRKEIYGLILLMMENFLQNFQFPQRNGWRFLDSRYQHNIKIIRVEDNGDVDFVLYGYMNRGVREGYCGVCIYYSNDQNVVEEKVFIPSTESYEFLKEDLGTLSYVSTENALYLLFANKLYKINISDGTSEVLEEGIKKMTLLFRIQVHMLHGSFRKVKAPEI